MRTDLKDRIHDWRRRLHAIIRFFDTATAPVSVFDSHRNARMYLVEMRGLMVEMFTALGEPSPYLEEGPAVAAETDESTEADVILLEPDLVVNVKTVRRLVGDLLDEVWANTQPSSNVRPAPIVEAVMDSGAKARVWLVVLAGAYREMMSNAERLNDEAFNDARKV